MAAAATPRYKRRMECLFRMSFMTDGHDRRALNCSYKGYSVCFSYSFSNRSYNSSLALERDFQAAKEVSSSGDKPP